MSAESIIGNELQAYLIDGLERDINPQILAVLDAAFGEFGRFHREALGLSDESRIVRKFRQATPDPDKQGNHFLVLLENILVPRLRSTVRTDRDRYDIPGEMIDGERTFHHEVAGQLRVLARIRPEGTTPVWSGYVRIKHWGTTPPYLQPYGQIPSFCVGTERNWRNYAFTTISFPANREDPSKTARHIELVLEVAKPQILAGFQGSSSLPF